MTTPTPAKPAGLFLTARWEHLIMLNFTIDPAVLEPLVPAGTELDLWQERVMVSMVGFRFLDTRVCGLPIPFHRNFDEVNLRFYVARHSGDERRRGVVFVKELVPRRAIAWVARTLYNENYQALPMDHRLDLDAHGRGSVTYRWQHGGRWHHLALDTADDGHIPADDSEQTFITEHYWGYARQRDGGTVEYQVEHPRWRVWSSARAELECEVAAMYGPQFIEALSAPPSSAFMADGSAVCVRRGRRIV